MAPWANIEHRFTLEEVNPTFDIFPLGKVLWCMISGRHQLQFWYFDKPERGSVPANNLEVLFPDDPAMRVINSVLAKCIVEDEAACLTTAAELLTEVDRAITQLRGLGTKPEDGSSWWCTVCKKGYYQKTNLMWRARFNTVPGGIEENPKMEIYFCDHCGHLAAFRWR
jgi:hypothetical protein